MAGKKGTAPAPKTPVPASINIVRSTGAPVKTVVVKPDGCCLDKKGAKK